MITRNYEKKSVMFITDMPLEAEIQRGAAYTGSSNVIAKDALLQLSLKEQAKTNTNSILNSNVVNYTYLCLTRYAKDDVDWKNSIVHKKEIPKEAEDYVQIPWLKDIYVSSDIYTAINNLINEIRQSEPKLIIIGGKWTFMFLATLINEKGKQLATIGTTRSTPKQAKWFGSLNKYRSSLLTLFSDITERPTIVIPILSPSHLFLIKDKTYIIKRDYAKIVWYYQKLCSGHSVESLLVGKRTTKIGKTKDEVIRQLTLLYDLVKQNQTRVAFDVETRMEFIDCIGIAYGQMEAFTIPFTEIYYETNVNDNLYAYVRKNNKEELTLAPPGILLEKYRHYWNIEDQVEIQHLLWTIMLHPNCLHIGQNYNFDCQFYFHNWKLSINSFCDTMILHHVLHNTLAKNLAVLASLYCMDYTYWKDDLEIRDNDIRWAYCGMDTSYTYSIANLLLKLLKLYPEDLQKFYFFQQFQVAKKFVTIMNRGIVIDVAKKEIFRNKFQELLISCEKMFNYVFNEEINLKSSQQTKLAFKSLLGIKPIKNKKTMESFGADAMLIYLEEYPEWRTILRLFLEYKSIGVFVRTFLNSEVDFDNRMRCNYNVAGTKTYRLSSRKNIFGKGMNLANVPIKGKIDLRIALQDYDTDTDTDTDVNTNEIALKDQNEHINDDFYTGNLSLPNCKSIFLPDNDNYLFFDADYSSVDLHFFVWESDCSFLKNLIRNKQDPYAYLASLYYQKEITKHDEERRIFKSVMLGATYLGFPSALAAKAGLSVPTVKRVVELYFKYCPEIMEWHEYLKRHASQYGYITNCFGARNEVFDFIDKNWLNKLVAWQPQSSAAILVNKAIVRLEIVEALLNNNREIQYPMQVKLQTHDSISGQFYKQDFSAIARLVKYMEIPIVFEKNEIRTSLDTLVIPAEVKISPISYGDCEKIKENSMYIVEKHKETAFALQDKLYLFDKDGMFDGRLEATKFNLLN